MIDLSDADVAEFQALWKKDTGRDLSDDEARQYALSIIQLVHFVVKKKPQRMSDAGA